MEHDWVGDLPLEKTCSRCGATGILGGAGEWRALVMQPWPSGFAARRAPDCAEEVVRRVLDD